MIDPRVRRLIVKEAIRQGLDPEAVLAVASVEGGIHFGAVGDDGTSFGPFQLHVGGALPQGRGANWANSPAGIRYAIRQIDKVVPEGARGRTAVAHIVKRFERPAAPDAEIARAMGNYGKLGAGKIGAGGVKSALPVSGVSPAMDRQFRAAAAAAMLQASQQSLAGDPSGGSQTMLGLAIARRQALTAQAESRANEFGGTTVGPAPPAGHNKITDKAIKAATSQLGKPYVWGAESPQEGFDCSGLIDWAYRQAGIDFPGRLTTRSAMRVGKSVKGGDYRAGDLIITNGGEHMVMYVGGGRVIAAPHRGEPVQYQPLSRFKGDIVDVRRVT